MAIRIVRIAKFFMIFPQRMRVKLLAHEEEIVQLLVSAAHAFAADNPKHPPITLRIAGGWVRDKLLGLQSDDIDVAIDSMHGLPFANHLHIWMDKKGKNMSQVCKIVKNPDKSKHLETATARILGHDIDFVNLRTETYDENSRNPEVEFGTPYEDAMRRDITINALFYNLSTREVEDFTGHGREDIEKGIIRTPLPPHETFVDDPLRVLRVIRFATRFGFKIVPEIMDAAIMDDIQNAFMKKISRERVGVEVDKMMKGKNPNLALKLICAANFHPLVFSPPEEVVNVDSWEAYNTSEKLSNILKNNDTSQLFGKYISESDLKYLYLACAVSPYRSLTFKVKNKINTFSKHIVMNSLKLSTIDSEMVHSLLNYQEEILKVVDNAHLASRKEIGMLIRLVGQRPLEHKWPLSIIMTMVIQLISLNSNENLVVKKFIDFLKQVDDLNLNGAYAIKPLFNGKELSELIGETPGPKIGLQIESLIQHQLEFPDITKAEAETWIKQNI